jgi:hypothetical protein
LPITANTWLDEVVPQLAEMQMAGNVDLASIALFSADPVKTIAFYHSQNAGRGALSHPPH